MRRLSTAIAAILLIALALPSVADAVAVTRTYPVGHEPFGVAVDPTDGRVYVANSNTTDPLGNGRVSVVEPVSGSVTSLATSGVADFVSVDGAARRMYSSNANRTLDIFDLVSGARINTLAVGGLAMALDAPGQRLYVAGARDVAVIDTATGALLATIAAPAGESWFSVAVDPALRRVYIADTTPGTAGVVVLDDMTRGRVTKLMLPVSPRYAMAVDTVTHRLYVAGFDQNVGYGGSRLLAFDGASLSQNGALSVPGFPSGLVLDHAANRLYETDLTGSLRVIDASTLQVVSSVPLPWNAAMAELHPDAKLYVAAQSADLLAAIDRSENTAPVVDSVRISPDPPFTNDTVAASVTAHDADGDPLTFSYRWYRNGTRLSASSPTLDLSVAGNGDRGDRIEVIVVASDGKATSAEGLTSTWVVTVANSAPTLSASLSDTTPDKHDVLVATATASDADRDALLYTYTWRINGFVRQTTTGTASASSSFDLRRASAKVGDRVTVDAAVSDGTARASASAGATVTPAGR